MRPARRGSSSRPRPRTLVALLLISAGAVLAFGPKAAINAWDTYLARLQQAETDRWVASHVSSGPVHHPRRVDDQAMTPGRTGYLLEIPRIGVRIVVHVLEPGVFQGLNTPNLYRYGVGQVPFTTTLGNVSPGAPGTAVITGHRTTSGAPFRHLDLLQPGDLILLRKGAAIQRWRVDASAVVAPTDVDVIRSRPGIRRLVLLTCTPPFSARSRLMIDARLAQADVAKTDTSKRR